MSMTREEAIRVFKAWIERDEKMKYADRLENIEIYNMAIEALKEQRPHGEWIPKTFSTLKCSKCEFEFNFMRCDFYLNMFFCPNCGASMLKLKESYRIVKEGETE